MSDEQPRKKPRLTGPDSVDSPAVPAAGADAVATQLEQEKKAGITVFASQASGFGGVVKKRYTDFLVNEISPSGLVFHLDELTGPAVKAVKGKEEQPEKKQEQQAEKGAAAEKDKQQDNEADEKERRDAAIAAVSIAKPLLGLCHG